ncbi:MAG: tRNA threonylcarbamoyladenosine dehydratase [Lachnospiraceae bacterium]|nr:tRNA threonylcarbamoyladenosine dehydratase [Lachnospiraceae bacterium]
MIDQFSRTKLLIGEEGAEKLANARVAVFGIGGVGGYVCEALARSGVGHFDLIDNDTVSLTNINRQIIALNSTVGKYKTEIMWERMKDINPNVDVNVHNCFFLPENADDFDFTQYDYVVDAVDTVAAKLSIIMKAKEAGVLVISSMGAGNKLDPTMFKVADIYKTKVCPLAKVMRRELKNRGVKKLKVVYSEELPVKQDEKTVQKMREYNGENPEIEKPSMKRSTPGSVAFVPSVAGLIIASEVVKDLLKPNV